MNYLDGDSLKKLYIALVRPVLEYGNVAWSPRLKKDKILIEQVQRRATKLVPHLKNLTYEQRLQKLKLPSMSYRRARGDMIEVYKYLHNINSANSDLLIRDTGTITRGHPFKLKKTSLQDYYQT